MRIPVSLFDLDVHHGDPEPILSRREPSSLLDRYSWCPRRVGEPSVGLLDRALIGWERFLSTFEGVPNE
ncbi:hypothetical protein [Streptomyces sp. NBC_00091]|uniref:hypothetical protein n=1 Tax=Streptomyces sp. NBC_00091 TaxID=2975648 RepID=UPI002253393D|nr:hypothetical protein [Streptomyces sp. NBC_00091]MCX5375886.1 hypothetical protein [Streptomyces sp. NBC_00091]